MLKVGIFGIGHLGKFHLNNWLEIEDIEVVGFYDISDAMSKEVIEKYGIKRFDTIDALLEAIDIADIVVPTNHHFTICEAAIKKGKHIFVEKPLTQNIEEAQILIEMVKEANIKMQVGHVERFNPAFVAAKKHCNKPMFIEVHRLAEFNPRGTEVSVILDLMIHDIDIILSLVQSNVKSIHANGINILTETPDIANVRIEFQNGCVANLTSSRISLKKMRKIRLFQKDAYIGIDLLEKKTEIIKLKGEQDEQLYSFDIELANGNKKTLAIDYPNIENSNAIKEELKAFVKAIKEDTPTIVSEIDGYLALKVANKILEKINTNNQ